MSFRCPLCSASLGPSSLEPHLRFELRYPASGCLLCPLTFCGEADARRHFGGRAHGGARAQLLSVPEDRAKEAQLQELLRLATGGEEEVERRLCVCGQCRLVCREEVTKEPSENPVRVEKGSDRPFFAPGLSFDTAEQEAQDKGEAPVVEEQLNDVCQSAEGQIPPEEEADPEQLNEGFPEADTEEKEEPAKEEDLTPQVEVSDQKQCSDGKVACLNCGSKYNKRYFSSHVKNHHFPGSPYKCLLCPASSKARWHLLSHMKKQHNSELNSTNFRFSGSKELVKKLVALCFGDLENIKSAAKCCKSCGKSVRKSELKRHIASAHLKRVLFKCRSCPYGVTNCNPKDMRTHVQDRHKLTPGPETIDSSGMERHSDVIKAMVPQFFDL